MGKTPASALQYPRYYDLFYLRPDQINPQNKDLAISLFDPSRSNAFVFAQKIEYFAGAKGFIAEQEPKIRAAQERKILRDPLNPDNMHAMRNIIFAKYPGTTVKTEYGNELRFKHSRQATLEYMEYLNDVISVAPYRPEPRTRLANLKAYMPGGYLLAHRSLPDFEKAITLSNYKLKYVQGYFYQVYTTEANLQHAVARGDETNQVQISYETEPLNQLEFYPANVLKGLECPIVRAARLTDYLCQMDAQTKESCRQSSLTTSVNEMLENARKYSYCPALIDAPIEYLAFEDEEEGI
jgi:hypothetical protein